MKYSKLWNDVRRLTAAIALATLWSRKQNGNTVFGIPDILTDLYVHR